jgi:hypothetical protein
VLVVVLLLGTGCSCRFALELDPSALSELHPRSGLRMLKERQILLCAWCISRRSVWSSFRARSQGGADSWGSASLHPRLEIFRAFGAWPSPSHRCLRALLACPQIAQRVPGATYIEGFLGDRLIKKQKTCIDIGAAAATIPAGWCSNSPVP